MVLFIITLIAALLLFYIKVISYHQLISVLIGLIVPTINFIIFFTLLTISFGKSNKIFLIFNLGGMGFRLILMLVVVFITLKYLNIDVYGFIFVFFLWYVLLLVYEIILIKNKLEKQLKSTKNA
ncbi:MAG: hypothetical protein AB1521_13905 [Bacteroidota bacterium]